MLRTTLKWKKTWLQHTDHTEADRFMVNSCVCDQCALTSQMADKKSIKSGVGFSYIPGFGMQHAEQWYPCVFI